METIIILLVLFFFGFLSAVASELVLDFETEDYLFIAWFYWRGERRNFRFYKL